MNKHQFENLLRDAADTPVSVSDRLHQNVMRKIRLSQPVRKKAAIHWAVPAWGGVLAIGAIAILSVTQTDTPQQAAQGESQFAQQPVSLLRVSDQLLTISEESLLPEKQLRLELERLKQDLKRFDIRS